MRHPLGMGVAGMATPLVFPDPAISHGIISNEAMRNPLKFVHLTELFVRSGFRKWRTF